jgi:hypothetical protein
MRDLGHPPFIPAVVKDYETLLEKPSSTVVDEYTKTESERTNSNVNF